MGNKREYMNQSKEDFDIRKKRIILIILILLLLLLFKSLFCLYTYRYYMKEANTSESSETIKNLNIDLNNDGICDLNCDTDGDGKADTNIDLDGDGKADINIVSDNADNKDITDTEKCNGNCEENIEIPSAEPEANENVHEGEYVIELKQINELTSNQIHPGWSGVQEFKITNNNPGNITFDIEWIDVANNFTEENNLYFDLIRNDKTVISSQRTPYKAVELKKNETVLANTTNTYKIVYTFKETNTNQNIDKDKIFKANIKITNVSVSK